MSRKRRVDVRVTCAGSLVCFEPETAAARAWVAANIPADAPGWGRAGFVAEPRYAGDIVDGMTEAGLRVE